MDTQEETIAKKVDGEKGLGEGVFLEEEGPVLSHYIEDVVDSIDENHGVTGATAKIVLAIAKHREYNSFEVKANGHRKEWERIGEMTARLVKHEPAAHLLVAAREQGFIEAKRVTQKAISSGFTVQTVKNFVLQNGSSRLRTWVNSLTPGMQQELDDVISQAAAYFWEGVDHNGLDFIDDWVDTMQKMQILTPSSTTNGQVAYNESSMGERLSDLPEQLIVEAAEQKFGMKDCLEPQEATEAMQAVLDEQLGGYDGKPRRKPFRTQEIMRAFEKREFGAVTIEDLEEEFHHDPDRNLSPRKAVTNTISALNRSFEELGLDVKIESVRITVYRFCRRST